MPLEDDAKKVLGSSDDNNSRETDAVDNVIPDVTDMQHMLSETDCQEESKSESDVVIVDSSKPETVQPDYVTEEMEKLGGRFQNLAEEVTRLSTTQRDLELKVVQTLKENTNFQIQVRQNMQKDLEEAKKKLSGDIFIPLLKEIAEIYVEWQDVLEDMEDGSAKRKVAGIFELLLEILEEYGCEFGTSPCDTKRRPKYSKLRNKVLTSDKSRHETISHSHNPWIVKEPFVLYPEYVDVYVFDKSLMPENIDDVVMQSADEAATSLETLNPTNNKEE